MLEAYTPADASAIPADTRDPKGEWYPLVNNYFCFIYNGSALQAAPKNMERSARSEVQGQDPVFDARTGR